MTDPCDGETIHEGYTREEVHALRDNNPDRGPLCHRCGLHIPRFADLAAEDLARILALVLNGQKVLATHELCAATGCSLRWAKIWVIHEGRPGALGSAPCPFCGKPLRTSRARQCPHCLRSWHEDPGLDPDNAEVPVCPEARCFPADGSV